jgi:sulfite reductase alpha subunit-like flavoprotein
MSQSTSPLFVLYGSATGNAEHIAKDLAATYTSLLKNPDTDTYFPSVVCCELDQFKRKCQPTWEQEPAGLSSECKHGVIVVTSTTGNADPPENAGRFFRYIKRKGTVDDQPFRHCAFAVLALGDTNYDQFCYTGKVVDKKLQELGGKRAFKIACADEAVGLEDVVEPWTADVLKIITNACRGSTSATTDKPTTGAPQAETETDADAGAEEKKVEHMDNTAAVQDNTTLGTSLVAPAPVQVQEVQVQVPLPLPLLSTGVQTIRALMQVDASKPIWEVDASVLPGLGSNLSSCELVNEIENEQDNGSARERSGSISTTSSAGFHYTIKRPFESTVLKARYLTETSLDAARKVLEKIDTTNSEEQSLTSAANLLTAHEIYDDHFSLTGSTAETERNSKRVIEVTLSLPDDYTLEYAPGDSLGLMVENTPDAVAFVLTMLKEQYDMAPDQKVSIDSSEPITVDEAVRTSIDLCSPIKNRRILHSFSQFATDSEEICALQLLASKTSQGEQLFQELVDKQRLSPVDILREFPSLQTIPLNGLLSILPGIPPRYYSVSSSPIEHQRLSLTVAFSVVDYVTPSLLVDAKERGLRRVRGIATRYMEALCCSFLAGSKNNGNASTTCTPTLKIFPKPTADFRMPATLSVPLVLIGPGTGVAPFMGFLAHRKSLLASSESTEAANSVVEGTWRGGYELEENELPISEGDASGLKLGVDYRTKQDVGSVDLFFGCRHRDHDWLYRSEMQEFEKQGVVSKLYTAFSRDGNRQYVQDIMRSNEECAARLADLILEKKAGVYVCGDGNAMAKDVQAAIVELLSSRLGGVEQATEYLEQMKTDKRFLLDIWS